MRQKAEGRRLELALIASRKTSTQRMLLEYISRLSRRGSMTRLPELHKPGAGGAECLLLVRWTVRSKASADLSEVRLSLNLLV